MLCSFKFFHTLKCSALGNNNFGVNLVILGKKNKIFKRSEYFITEFVESIQSTLLILTSLILNKRLSRRENMVPVLT